MTDNELSAIEARANAATEGPWRIYTDEETDGLFVFTTVRRDLPLAERFGPNGDEDRANMAFIAHSRQDVPALVEEVRRLRALVQNLWALVKDRPPVIPWDEEMEPPLTEAYRYLDTLGRAWHLDCAGRVLATFCPPRNGVNP